MNDFKIEVILKKLELVIKVLNNVEIKGKTNLTNQAAGIDLIEQIYTELKNEMSISGNQEG